MFLILLLSFIPFRGEPIGVVIADDTVWISPDSIYCTNPNFKLSGKFPTSIGSGSFVADGTKAQAFKAEYNVASQLGAWVHGVKVEMTRTADIQPATGGWMGGQFVLNSGTTDWVDVNKASYAVQGVIKGNQWSGSVDVNSGRFELQSSGSVRDIVYILANIGTSVSSSMLYMPTHISLPNMIQFNAQSNSTVTNGINFVTGAGSQFKHGFNFRGAKIDTAEIVLQNGETINNITNGIIGLSGITRSDTLQIPISTASINGSGSWATMFVDTVGTDSLIIMIGSIRRGIAIQ